MVEDEEEVEDRDEDEDTTAVEPEFTICDDNDDDEDDVVADEPAREREGEEGDWWRRELEGDVLAVQVALDGVPEGGDKGKMDEEEEEEGGAAEVIWEKEEKLEADFRGGREDEECKLEISVEMALVHCATWALLATFIM